MDNKTIGIITEYNPFHNGHALQIRKIRNLFPNCNIVVVMSGFFLQRGQIALFDKWHRAELAISNGVNLVLELPFNFACRSAETFAFGGVFLLTALKKVDYLAFGAETKNLDDLKTAASLFSSNNFRENLKQLMKKGLSYPQAVDNIMSQYLPIDTVRQANNILAIEYLKALKNLNSNIKPLLIPREVSQYREISIHSSIASATAIREELKGNGLTPLLASTMPKNSFEMLKQLSTNKQLIYAENIFSNLLIYKLRTTSLEYIRQHSDVSEGLEHSICKHSEIYNDYPSLLAALTNKRYPQSRINRLLTQILIGLEKTANPTYIRPLAFDKTGVTFLNKIKNNASLPIITKLGKNFKNIPTELAKCANLKTDIAATNIYQLLYPENNGIHNLDFLTTPKYIK